MAANIPSLAGLSSILQGLGGAGGGQKPKKYTGPNIGGVPKNPDGSPNLTNVSGPGLANVGRVMADDQDAKFDLAQEEAVRSSAHPIDQARAQFMGKLGRGRGGADWRSFFGLMSGKKMTGFGQPGFQEGRIAPGTSDVVSPMGRTYHDWEFDNPSTDPRTISGRSGLSLEALKALGAR